MLLGDAPPPGDYSKLRGQFGGQHAPRTAQRANGQFADGGSALVNRKADTYLVARVSFPGNGEGFVGHGGGESGLGLVGRQITVDGIGRGSGGDKNESGG